MTHFPNFRITQVHNCTISEFPKFNLQLSICQFSTFENAHFFKIAHFNIHFFSKCQISKSNNHKCHKFELQTFCRFWNVMWYRFVREEWLMKLLIEGSVWLGASKRARYRQRSNLMSSLNWPVGLCFCFPRSIKIPTVCSVSSSL